MATRGARFLPGLLVAFLVAAGGPVAAQPSCSKADEANATKAIDRISAWGTLQNTWKTWKHCDRGEVADQFTEALLRLVVDWKQVDALANAMKDTEYRDFVMRHLTSPAAQGDLDDVYSRAKRNCPKGLEAWCDDLAKTLKPPAATPAPAVPELQPIAPSIPTLPPSAPLPPTAPPKKP